MDASIKKYMKVGIIHFMAYPQTMKGEGDILPSIRRIAADDYFDAIEVAWIKDDAQRAQAAQLMRTSRIAVGYGASPRLLTTGLNPNDVNEQGRKAAEETLLAGIDEAYEIGAGGLGYLSGKYSEDMKEEAFQALLTTTRNMCHYAAAKGDLKILLEIFDYDVDKCSLIGPTPLAKRFYEELTKDGDCANFGLMVDLSHIPLMHETIEESIYPIKDYIKHAHMGNAVMTPGKAAYGDAHPRFGFPYGENDVEELTQYLRALLDIGYLNTENPPIVSFEVKPVGDEDPEMVIANAKRTLNAAWARV